MHGKYNIGFTPDDDKIIKQTNDHIKVEGTSSEINLTSPKKREQWGNGVEFLLSCIAMSVGLGNVWRFPYIAYKNGGGAFLIPYIIVLLLVGKPMYFLEMILGQFSSKGPVKMYDFAPAMRGVGVGQTVAVSYVLTYYASIMAIVVYYMIASFSSQLPWSVCDPSWTDCYSIGNETMTNSSLKMKSSSELYYTKTVLNEVADINDGIGLPGWKLALCLVGVWISIFLVVQKGVKSSGKASYFLAIFPYFVLFILLIRAVTLPGAVDGIIFFIKPDFEKILESKVWYEAVTQCFFSLSVGFGIVVMFSSFNTFDRNIYRDALIVTSMDTVTSFLAGCTIFGVLGNLAHETKANVSDVVRSSSGLAFISYPEAISKFQAVPQIFSFLFFVMMFVLGIGSTVAVVSSVVTVIKDKYPKLRHWQALLAVSVVGFLAGLFYVTPGGQFIMELVDKYGGSTIMIILATAQLISVAWIYGVKNFCDDVEFMLHIKLSPYWRVCWVIITPMILLLVTIASLVPDKDKTNVAYPIAAIVVGWLISASGLINLPLFAGFSIYKRRSMTGKELIKSVFSPRESWGPVDPQQKADWLEFKELKRLEREVRDAPRWRQIYNNILGY